MITIRDKERIVLDHFFTIGGIELPEIELTSLLIGLYKSDEGYSLAPGRKEEIQICEFLRTKNIVIMNPRNGAYYVGDKDGFYDLLKEYSRLLTGDDFKLWKDWGEY